MQRPLLINRWLQNTVPGNEMYYHSNHQLSAATCSRTGRWHIVFHLWVLDVLVGRFFLNLDSYSPVLYAKLSQQASGCSIVFTAQTWERWDTLHLKCCFSTLLADYFYHSLSLIKGLVFVLLSIAPNAFQYLLWHCFILNWYWQPAPAVLSLHHVTANRTVTLHLYSSLIWHWLWGRLSSSLLPPLGVNPACFLACWGGHRSHNDSHRPVKVTRVCIRVSACLL